MEYALWFLAVFAVALVVFLWWLAREKPPSLHESDYFDYSNNSVPSDSDPDKFANRT